MGGGGSLAGETSLVWHPSDLWPSRYHGDQQTEGRKRQIPENLRTTSSTTQSLALSSSPVHRLLNPVLQFSRTYTCLLWALKSRQRPCLCSEDVSPLLGEAHLNSGSRREREGLPSLQRNQGIFHIHVGSGSSPALFFILALQHPPSLQRPPYISRSVWCLSSGDLPVHPYSWSKNVLLLYLPQHCDSMIPDSV